MPKMELSVRTIPHPVPSYFTSVSVVRFHMGQSSWKKNLVNYYCFILYPLMYGQCFFKKIVFLYFVCCFSCASDKIFTVDQLIQMKLQKNTIDTILTANFHHLKV